MKLRLQVLDQDECAQIHERSVRLLQDPGVRVLSEPARRILSDAGASVDSDGQRLRLPRTLIEQSLKLAPRHFTLGARRPGWDLEMNADRCWLLADGGAVSVLDLKTRELRPGARQDWISATRLIDALDEIGVYWNMVEAGFDDSPAGLVDYWRNLLAFCSKHVQDSVDSVEKAHALIQVLDITFGGRQALRSGHPFSYVLCPMSPLVIDASYTDAYLQLSDLGCPVAIMPMPLMGATAPASLLSTMLVANADFLASLCLVQAAAPGSPAIYAAVPQAVEPRTWKYTGGAVENGLFGAATAAMGRYYGLPVEAGTGGSDQYYPGVQAAYERSLNWTLPVLTWPDLLVGPGLLGGSTILCLEQILIDVEVFRRCSRLRQGAPTSDDLWFDDVLRRLGPGASFIAQKSTLGALRDGTFYLSDLGFHDTYEKWKVAGMPDALDQVSERTREILDHHQPLALDPQVDRELERLARSLSPAGSSIASTSPT